MSDELYQRDFHAWALEQAAGLRNPGSNTLDYENLAEEIEGLARSDMKACRSQMINILKHLLKIEYVGPSETVGHWRKELRAF